MHRTGEGAFHRGEKKGAQKILKILKNNFVKKMSFKTTHLMFTACGVQAANLPGNHYHGSIMPFAGVGSAACWIGRSMAK